MSGDSRIPTIGSIGDLAPVVAALGAGASASAAGDTATRGIVARRAVDERSGGGLRAGLQRSDRHRCNRCVALPDLRPATLDGRTSSGIVAKLVAGAHVVKGANTLSAELLGVDLHDAGGRRGLFLSGKASAA